MTARSAEVAGFRLTEGIHPGGSEIPWHSHDGATICFVLAGAFTEHSRGQVLTCTPTTLKFMPAGEGHSNRFALGDSRGLLIEVDPGREAALREHAPVLGEKAHFQGGLPMLLARRVWEEFDRMDAAAPLAIEGILLELLAVASRRDPPADRSRRPRWLLDAEAIVREESAAGLTLSTLAERIGVHPVTLARGFRRRHACSLGEYLRRVRVDRAAAQLATTATPIAAIALACGFADQSHFTNVFRQHTGLSPARWRRAFMLP